MNKEQRPTNTEEQDRQIGYLWVVVGVAFLFGLLSVMFAVSRYNEISNLEQAIPERQALAEQRIAENEERQLNYYSQYDEERLEAIQNDANVFLNLFFDWNGWGGYSMNMREVSETFPHLQDDPRIDTEGIDVGFGNGPSSMHRVLQVSTGVEEGQVGYFIEQTKGGVVVDGTTREQQRTYWYFLYDDTDDQLNIIELRPFMQTQTIN